MKSKGPKAKRLVKPLSGVCKEEKQLSHFTQKVLDER